MVHWLDLVGADLRFDNELLFIFLTGLGTNKRQIHLTWMCAYIIRHRRPMWAITSKSVFKYFAAATNERLDAPFQTSFVI